MLPEAKLPLLRQLDLIPLLQAGAALVEGPDGGELRTVQCSLEPLGSEPL
jgi:hypothetical protein